MRSPFKAGLLLILCFTLFRGNTQDIKKTELKGHLQHLGSVWVPEGSSKWVMLGSVYNRLNFNWYMNDNLTFSASARNIFNYGELIYITYPDYTNLLTQDEGIMNLTGTIASDSSYVLFTNIDRLNFQFNKGNVNVRVGRQRINWGINMVWNPNDIFNTFNYYDFDYVERPGCDAIRVQYYTGVTSSAEAAFKIDADEKITAAGMYRFNQWNYDFQVMGGVMTDDVVIGGGWSGYIGGAGFTGEASWFRDIDNFADTSSILVMSAGANYTFRNSLYIHGSMLYNSDGTTGNAGWGNNAFLLGDLSPKTFTLARFSIMGQVSYTFSPLVRGDISTIVNPNDGSFFLGPNIDISLADNLSLLLMGQIFIGDPGTEFGDSGQLYYMRIKWFF